MHEDGCDVATETMTIPEPPEPPVKLPELVPPAAPPPPPVFVFAAKPFVLPLPAVPPPNGVAAQGEP